MLNKHSNDDNDDADDFIVLASVYLSSIVLHMLWFSVYPNIRLRHNCTWCDDDKFSFIDLLPS